MSADQARALANVDFAIEKGTSELRAKWYEKMSKVLSERTVARFFHIDEKRDASSTSRLRPTSHLSTEPKSRLPRANWNNGAHSGMVTLPGDENSALAR
jgi:hypothetical protein